MDTDPQNSTEALRLAQRRVERLENIVRVQRIALTVCVVLLTVVLLASVFRSQRQFARAILIGDELCCLVAGQREAEAVRQRIIDAARGDLPGEACIEQKWQDAAVPVEGRPILSVAEAVERLSAQVTVKVEATAIKVDGITVAALPSADLAQKSLDTLKSQYIGDESATVISQKLQPEVSLVTAGVRPEDISTDIRQVVQKLSEARGEARIYTVQPGDFPEKIVKASNMTLAEFYQLNPGIKGKTLHPGDKLKVGPAAAAITVVTVMELTKEQPVQPTVEKQYSPALKRGEEQVSSEGKSGRRKVTYRITKHNDKHVRSEVVTEQVVEQAEPKRVLIGTGDSG